MPHQTDLKISVTPTISRISSTTKTMPTTASASPRNLLVYLSFKRKQFRIRHVVDAFDHRLRWHTESLQLFGDILPGQQQFHFGDCRLAHFDVQHFLRANEIRSSGLHEADTDQGE
jgi:hypothetical protein